MVIEEGKNMAALKSYTCAKCGGILNYDKDQEVFGCPFCGADFAVGNFHRNELLKEVDVCLQDMEFHAAREKIDNILDQYPNDPLVLRALILCEGRCNSVETLAYPDRMGACDLTMMEQAAVDVQGRCDDKDKPYFDKILELIRTAEKYNDLKTGVRAVPQAGTDHLKQIAKADEAYERSWKESLTFLFGDLHGNDGEGSLSIFVLGAIIVVAVFFIGGKRNGLIALAILLGVAIAYLLLTTLIRRLVYHFRTAPLRKGMDDLHKFEDSSIKGSESAERTYKEIYKKLLELAPDEQINAPSVRPRAPKIPMAEIIDTDKKIVCNNCGGNLVVDEKKQFFECRFCGVAYGSSLFFGDPFGKALEAMGNNEYTEADQRFTHMLMLDSHDFNALLGRFLCSGKWKKVEELTLAHPLPMIRLKNLKERIDEIVPHASENDREYFSMLRKMIDDRIELLRLETEVNRIQKGVTGDEPCFGDRNRLTSEFNTLRDKVLQETRDMDFIAGIPLR